MFLKHIGQEKYKYIFQIKVIELRYFEPGFKLMDVDQKNDSFFVKKIILIIKDIISKR
jgi:hypothetical protein